MPHVTYGIEKKREVIATATVAGAPFAAVRHGVDVRTVREWMRRAGRQPADSITSADWSSLGEMARTQVASALAAGRVSPSQAAVIAAIAQRNATKPENVEASAEDLRTRRYERLGGHHVIAFRMSDRMGYEGDALDRELEARYNEPLVEQYVLKCLQRREQAHGCVSNDRNEYDTDCPEPLEDPWQWVDGLGFLDEWLERQYETDRVQAEAQVEAFREAREVERMAALNEETKALVAAAEAFLAETAA